MDIEVVDRTDQHRFEILVDGDVAGFAEYRSGAGRRAFVHTVVDERYGGQGLGSKLVRGALDATRAEALAVEPFCPFVRSYIAGHDEYVDLVPPDRREAFDLPVVATGGGSAGTG